MHLRLLKLYLSCLAVYMYFVFNSAQFSGKYNSIQFDYLFTLSIAFIHKLYSK